MRTWTYREPSPAGGAWIICAADREVARIIDWPGTEDAQFIVDALNEKEQRTGSMKWIPDDMAEPYIYDGTSFRPVVPDGDGIFITAPHEIVVWK